MKNPQEITSHSAQGSLSRPRRIVRFMGGLCLAGAALATSGCGPKPEARVPTYAVAGKVTVAGKAEQGVRVTLVPKDRSKPQVRQAQGITDKDGTYTLSTYVANDGAQEGDFAVTLQYPKLVDNGGGSVPGPNVLPVKYSKPETTDIHFQVKAGSNTIPAVDIK